MEWQGRQLLTTLEIAEAAAAITDDEQAREFADLAAEAHGIAREFVHEWLMACGNQLPLDDQAKLAIRFPVKFARISGTAQVREQGDEAAPSKEE